MLEQANLLSLLLLPLWAYLAGAIVITLLERFFTKAPACSPQDGL
ncbi:hypothetical protein [Bowmanella dokdonensis]|nr:hypothetical protein [Bowmanella dokdonensis]